MSIVISDHAIFHVHTPLCGHADHVPIESYVDKAVAAGADEIWFTDHAPFPGDQFFSRMKYGELPVYISDLEKLKRRRKNITVHIGLEIEYLDTFANRHYYDLLLQHYPQIECLLLGQHFAELDNGEYSYQLSVDDKKDEYVYLSSAIERGMQTKLFCAVAHPDRIFRHCKQWTPRMERTAKNMILTAARTGTALEINSESKRKRHQYWPQFWTLVKNFNSNAQETERIQIIYGADAHHLREIIIPPEQ